MPFSACLHTHRPVMKSVVKASLHCNAYYLINTLHTCLYPGLPVAFHLDSDLMTNSPCWERRAWKIKGCPLTTQYSSVTHMVVSKPYDRWDFPISLLCTGRTLGTCSSLEDRTSWETLGVILINLHLTLPAFSDFFSIAMSTWPLQ